MPHHDTLQTANGVADRAATRADQLLRSGTNAAHQALDSLSVQARQWQAEAGHLSQRGLDALRDNTRQLRETAHRAGDRTVDYVQHQPVKSLLLAAATGAALMALVSLLGRSDR